MLLPSNTEKMILQHFEAELTNLSNLQHLRHHCDTDTDLALSAIQRQLREGSEAEPLRHQNDLLSVLRAGNRVDPVLAKLWSDVNSVPEWVDWSQLERGQRVFHRYILASITGFILQGFIGENSAASGVVEVLVLTGGFDPKNLTRRLKETFRWLLEVTSNLQSIQPGGKGHADTIRVRLLHAQVRQRVLALAARKPGYYDSAKFGLPINTLDSVHSISTFCCSPMCRNCQKWEYIRRMMRLKTTSRSFDIWVTCWGFPTPYSTRPLVRKRSCKRWRNTNLSRLPHLRPWHAISYRLSPAPDRTSFPTVSWQLVPGV